MKGKRVFYCETAYILGIIILALGTALMEKANFGMSMIVAPAYLIHLKVSQFVPFFSFGISEYVFQTCLLILLSLIMHKVKKSYFLSLATAFIYGIFLDTAINLIALINLDGIIWQIIYFIFGMVICSSGVALLFHTYIPPAAYDLFVKEVTQKTNLRISKVKTIYDFCSLIFSIALALIFFGNFVGINWGTIVCTMLNGFLIGRISSLLEKKFIFKDALNLRSKID